MDNLHSTLSGLAAAIIHNDTVPPQCVEATPRYSINTGLEVYRNNYYGNLQNALAGAYPIIEQLVGNDFFRMMAQHFIEQFPSKSGNLHGYGMELSVFLADFSPAQTLAYLPDVAALEWACHLAYFTPDEPGFNLDQLAQITPEQYPNLKLHVSSACQILNSIYPVTAIWQAHQPGADDNFHINLDCPPNIAMVSRQHGAVNVIELNPADALWLTSIMADKTLGDATAATLDTYPDFNLQSALLSLIALDVLTQFTLGE